MTYRLFNTIFSRGLVISFTFLSTIIITRILSVEDRGQYAVLTSAILLMMQVFTFGFHTSIVYNVSKNKEMFSYFYYIAFLISVFSLLLTLILSLLKIIELFFPEFSNIDLFLLTIGTACVLFSYYNSNLLVAINKFFVYNIFEFIKSSSFFLISLAGFFITKKYQYYVLFFIISYLFHIIILFPYLFKKGLIEFEKFKFKNCIRIIKESFNYSMTSYISCNLSFILSKYMLFFIGIFWGVDPSKKMVIGHYSVALSNIDVILLFPTTLSFFILPQISSIDTMKLKITLAARAIAIVLFYFLVIVVLSFTVAEYFFDLLYGVNYKNAVPMFQALLPTMLSLTVLSCISAFISGIGMPKIAIYAPLVGLVFIFFSSLFFLHSIFDIYDIIMAQNISYFIYLIIYVLFFIKKWKESEDEQKIFCRVPVAPTHH